MAHGFCARQGKLDYMQEFLGNFERIGRCAQKKILLKVGTRSRRLYNGISLSLMNITPSTSVILQTHVFVSSTTARVYENRRATSNLLRKLDIINAKDMFQFLFQIHLVYIIDRQTSLSLSISTIRILGKKTVRVKMEIQFQSQS